MSLLRDWIQKKRYRSGILRFTCLIPPMHDGFKHFSTEKYPARAQHAPA